MNNTFNICLLYTSWRARLNKHFPFLPGEAVNAFHQLIHPFIPFRAIAGRAGIRQLFHLPQHGKAGHPDGNAEDGLSLIHI